MPVKAQYTKHGRSTSKQTDHGTYHIDVTQQDIDDAVESNSYHCAVATAVARSIAPARMPNVDIQTIRFSRIDTGLRYVFLTPTSVQDYIARFDAGDKSLEPFSFTLHRPAYCGASTFGRGKGKQIKYEARVTKTSDDTGETPRSSNKIVARVRATPPPVRSGRRSFGIRAMRLNQGRMSKQAV